MIMRDRTWPLSLGPVFGKAGTTTTITVNPQCRYRVEQVFAQDTGDNQATRIMQFLVGNRPQQPSLAGSVLSTFFSVAAMENRTVWDTCEPGYAISVTVSFVQDATFDMGTFGRAV